MQGLGQGYSLIRTSARSRPAWWTYVPSLTVISLVPFFALSPLSSAVVATGLLLFPPVLRAVVHKIGGIGYPSGLAFAVRDIGLVEHGPTASTTFFPKGYRVSLKPGARGPAAWLWALLVCFVSEVSFDPSFAVGKFSRPGSSSPELTCANVHMVTGWNNIDAHRAQAGRVLDLRPDIVMGDFNSLENGGAAAILSSAGYERVSRGLSWDPVNNQRAAASGSEGAGSIDHIWARSAKNYQVRSRICASPGSPGREWSDHSPIGVELVAPSRT